MTGDVSITPVQLRVLTCRVQGVALAGRGGAGAGGRRDVRQGRAGPQGGLVRPARAAARAAQARARAQGQGAPQRRLHGRAQGLLHRLARQARSVAQCARF